MPPPSTPASAHLAGMKVACSPLHSCGGRLVAQEVELILKPFCPHVVSGTPAQQEPEAIWGLLCPLGARYQGPWGA